MNFQIYKPYVVVEVDDPGQRNQTFPADLDDKTTDKPQWNMDFTLLVYRIHHSMFDIFRNIFLMWIKTSFCCFSDITSKSTEILFEVWDKGDERKDQQEQKDAFLGLGIVSVEELQIATTSRHVIPLQGRPYFDADDDADENNINGLLTVEFVLLEKPISKRDDVSQIEGTKIKTALTSNGKGTFKIRRMYKSVLLE